MSTAPTLVPDIPAAGPLHFVLCDFGNAGMAIVETDPAAADEATIISNMLSGQYEVPLAVIAVDLAAGTSRDVSAEAARKVELTAKIDQRTLTDGVQTFVEATAFRGNGRHSSIGNREASEALSWRTIIRRPP
jgi:hypothetical protein